MARANSSKTSGSKIVNYTLDSPGKVTFEFLKQHLWSAADILRGALDASEYRQPIMTILFLKRLNDKWKNTKTRKRNKKKQKNYMFIRESLDQIFLFPLIDILYGILTNYLLLNNHELNSHTLEIECHQI